MRTSHFDVGEEDFIYACHVFRSGLLLEQAIPRLPVIKWLFNEINIFQQETNIKTLFPIRKGEKFYHLVKLTAGFDEIVLNSLTAKAEEKLERLTCKQISNYFFSEFLLFSIAFICIIFILSFLQPIIYSFWQGIYDNLIIPPNIGLMISCSLTGIVFIVYLLYKVNIKLFESVLLNNVVTILKQAQTAKEMEKV